MRRIVLIGGGGHCRSVIDSLSKDFIIEGIIDNYILEKNRYGIKILGGDEILQEVFNKGINEAFLTIGGVENYKVRREIIKCCVDIGYSFPNIIDERALISRDVSFGIGVFVGKGAVINSGSTIGDFSIINTGALVEHDSFIGEYVHLAPSSVVCGGCTILKDSHIGVNSTILQGVKIGERVMVGGGSVVLKDLENGIRVCGNPCRRI